MRVLYFSSFPDLFLTDKNKINEIDNSYSYKNNFNKTSKISTSNLKYYVSDNNSKSNFLNNSSFSKKKMTKLYNSDIFPNSKKKKINKNSIINEISNICTELNDLQKEIVTQKEQDEEDFNEKFEKIKDNEKDKIILNVIEDIKEKEKNEINSITEFLKQMNQKSYMTDLNKQYSTFKRGEHHNCMKQAFLKKLKKIHLIEKKEELSREMAYKTNYNKRIDIDRIKYSDLSKQRNIFNQKIIKIKQLSHYVVDHYNKNMNKCI